VATRSKSQRWLFGPGSDLLLGCGLGYALLVAGFLVADVEQRFPISLGLVALISILTGTPHYGATLLRAYGEPGDRRAYAFFTLYATAAVWTLFYAGLYSAWIGSLLLTLYMNWSPWHYTGQNYGIALLFLRRRGVEVTPLAKRLIYLFFLLSFLLTLLAFHGASGGGEYAPVQPYGGGTFSPIRLGIPSPYWEVAFVGAACADLALLLAAAALLLRRASPGDLAPTAMLALTQLLWFSLPAAARTWGWFDEDSPFASGQAASAFFWVATGHAVQYLWITTYYAARSEPLRARARYLVKTLAAGSFIWSVPALLYRAGVEGGSLSGIAFDQDVFVMLAAAVNIHHFILDGAIWKLRDGRVARILIRREASPAPDAGRPAPASPRRWLAPAVYALGAAATLTTLGALALRQFGLEPALRAADLVRIQASLRSLQWLRADSANDYLRIGKVAELRREPAHAAWSYRRSAEKQPRAAPYLALAQLELRAKKPESAASALETALAHDPNDPNVLFLLGLTRLRLNEPERAYPALQRAAALLPDNAHIRAGLERARRRSAAASRP
jgi:tetratricopeptide (TPR) repeat protein